MNKMDTDVVRGNPCGQNIRRPGKDNKLPCFPHAAQHDSRLNLIATLDRKFAKRKTCTRQARDSTLLTPAIEPRVVKILSRRENPANYRTFRMPHGTNFGRT